MMHRSSLDLVVSITVQLLLRACVCARGAVTSSRQQQSMQQRSAVDPDPSEITSPVPIPILLEPHPPLVQTQTTS
jgi:hypothetical protein